MKAILEFNLPEDREELRLALGAARLYAGLCDIKELVRLHLKHGDQKDSPTRIEEIRELAYDALMEFHE